MLAIEKSLTYPDIDRLKPGAIREVGAAILLNSDKYGGVFQMLFLSILDRPCDAIKPPDANIKHFYAATPFYCYDQGPFLHIVD